MHKKEDNQLPDDLISGYLIGDLTAESTKELINWLEKSSENKRYFDEYCEMWITSKAISKNQRYHYQEGLWKFKQKIKASDNFKISSDHSSTFRRLVKYAAVFIIAFSLGGLLFHFTGKNSPVIHSQSYNELVVPMGSKAQFLLSDGTSVILNAGSRLKYDSQFGISDRTVTLEGEGYFKVAKDAERTFTVKTSHLNIMALGTEFNVKAYSDDKTIETTLVEGSVEVEEITEKPGDKVLVLKPNQKLTFLKSDSSIIDESIRSNEKTENSPPPLPTVKTTQLPRLVTENIDVEPAISWKENRWVFEKQSLMEIATELERKFDVEIVFESEQLKNFRFSGIILEEPIDQVLEVMSISAPINFRLKGKIVTLSENKQGTHLKKNLYKRQ